MVDIEVTPALVKAYIDSKADVDIIGYARQSCSCLVAYAVTHAYPDVSNVIISGDTLYYLDSEDESHWVPLDKMIEAIIDGFDDCGGYDEPITKHDYLSRMEDAAWLR